MNLGPLLALGLIIAAFVFGSVALLADRVDPLERHYRAAELARADRLADSLVWADWLAGALWRIVPAVILLVLGVGLAVVLVLALHRRLASWPSIRADKVIKLTGVQARALAQSSRPDALPGPQTVALLGETLRPPIRRPRQPKRSQLVPQERADR